MARQLFAEHNLKGWIFKFDSAKRRFGQCNYGRKIISMSRHLTELNDEKQVVDTLLHEIAHALAGIGTYHGPAWKRVAKEIGCNAERCYDSQTVIKPPAPWIGTCPAGHEFSKHRQPTRQYSCNICGTASGAKGFREENLVSWKRV